MKYLFIDTSTHDLTIAIATDNEVLGITSSSNTNEHSKYALSELEKVFTNAQLKPEDIDKIMVVNGPGSFTGVRIGVTIGKTYAWALNKDIIPVSSLKAMALGYSGYDYYVSLLDARRNNVYSAVYDKNYNEVLKEQHMSLPDLKMEIAKLNGNTIVVSDINIDNISNPIKMDILNIVNKYKNEKPVNPHAFNPEYLKRVEAEEKLMGAIE